MPTPLVQDGSGEVGNGMTIHASKAGGAITRKLHVDSGGEFDADDFLELCAEATAKVRADRCRRGRRRVRG